MDPHTPKNWPDPKWLLKLATGWQVMKQTLENTSKRQLETQPNSHENNVQVACTTCLPLTDHVQLEFGVFVAYLLHIKAASAAITSHPSVELLWRWLDGQPPSTAACACCTSRTFVTRPPKDRSISHQPQRCPWKWKCSKVSHFTNPCWTCSRFYFFRGTTNRQSEQLLGLATRPSIRQVTVPKLHSSFVRESWWNWWHWTRLVSHGIYSTLGLLIGYFQSDAWFCVAGTILCDRRKEIKDNQSVWFFRCASEHGSFCMAFTVRWDFWLATFSLTRCFAWQAQYFVTGWRKSKIIKVSGFLGVQVNTARVLHVLAADFSACEQIQGDLSGSKEQWVKERQEYPFRIWLSPWIRSRVVCS